jgi:hypothetical protein
MFDCGDGVALCINIAIHGQLAPETVRTDARLRSWVKDLPSPLQGFLGNFHLSLSSPLPARSSGGVRPFRYGWSFKVACPAGPA